MARRALAKVTVAHEDRAREGCVAHDHLGGVSGSQAAHAQRRTAVSRARVSVEWMISVGIAQPSAEILARSRAPVVNACSRPSGVSARALSVAASWY